MAIDVHDSRSLSSAVASEKEAAKLIEELLKHAIQALDRLALQLAKESLAVDFECCHARGYFQTTSAISRRQIRLDAACCRTTRCRDLSSELLGNAPVWALEEVASIARTVLLEGQDVLNGHSRAPAASLSSRRSRIRSLWRRRWLRYRFTTLSRVDGAREPLYWSSKRGLQVFEAAAPTARR